MDNTRIAYLSNNTVHVIVANLREPNVREELEWSLPRGERETFGGLSCGPNESLLLHISRIGLDQAYSGVFSEIVTADVVKRTLTTAHRATDVSLRWPKLSPDEAWIAATAISNGTNSLAIVSRKSGATEIFPWRFSASADAWSPSGTKILLTTLDVQGQNWHMAEFDREKATFRRIADGGKPVVSSPTGYVAFLSSDQQSMSVIDAKEVPVATFHGFFNSIVGWIDNARVLFLTNDGLVAQLGFADISSGKIETRALTTFGEISGACILKGK